MTSRWLCDRLDALAGDVGRLGRHIDQDGYPALLLDRIAGHVEVLDAHATPTAHELYCGLVAEGMDEDEALAAALSERDTRTAALQSLLRRGLRAA